MVFTSQQPPGLLWPDYLRKPHPSTDYIQKRYLSHTFARTLERTNVLGDDDEYGHTGCVNALAWAEDGNLLLTAGDDTTVRLWRMDPTADSESDYPFVCRSVIKTGHRANIFNVAMLPHSDRIVTCAGDKQIRVFDAAAALDIQDGLETEFSARELSSRVIRCHKGRVKKLLTEDSPDVFLSLSEDGTVRQHDLRMRHNCREDDCPASLVEMKDSDGDPVELSNISLSCLTPYQFIVVGESPCGYLFDRRQLRRVMEHEWGMVPRTGEVTTCVRRFARPQPPPERREKRRQDHISGCRMSDTNGHEIILSYMKDNIYLFSTTDDPVSNDDMAIRGATVVGPNILKDSRSPSSTSSRQLRALSTTQCGPDEPMTDGAGEIRISEDEGGERPSSDDEEAELEFLFASNFGNEWQYSGVPVVHPRQTYAGHRSRDTVKDVNFLGPFDEYVVSGSDDGNWFVWQKDSGKLHGIYEGDSSVVNVVEGHPSLPLVAVSGIDTTVKLFSPAPGGASAFSRMHRAKEIMESNAKHKPVVRVPLAQLFVHAARMQLFGGEGVDGDEESGVSGSEPSCPTQ
ncbi:hypothetical protein D9611_002459 [Ephemerocybe angulata]|uniref:WD40 repeat-like protein n=1 Tax=Ephemerocybe angulata TaxID=980116 RepID=A0A8H5C1W7_9AGAR|nr:hypothetical protein D9611_002459 [Tulosesus angulatus]